MFALGVWDSARERLFLARDRVGIKPLYFCLRPGLALFASEIKALLVHPAVAAAPDPAALYHYLSFLTAPAPPLSFWELPKRRLVRRERLPRRKGVPAGLEALVPPAFLQLDSAGVIDHYRDAVARALPGADLLTRMAYLEFKLRLPELLLMRVDKMTTVTSVEARVPFLDHRLVELTMALPMASKVAGGVTKHLLKRACEGILPADVIHRRKVGFAAPFPQWLRGDFGGHAEATVLASPLVRAGILEAEGVRSLFGRHRAGGDASLAIWTLYNLAAWLDRWVAGRRAA